MTTMNDNHLNERLTNNTSGDDSLLYHYTSLNSACKILETKTLKLSNLPNTNDPLEFIDGGGFSYTGWGDFDYIKIARELTTSGRRRQNYVRMLCFCKDNFCSLNDWKNEKQQNFSDNLLHKGWARSRMWAQYADNHNGICFVFDKPQFRKHFNELKNTSKNITILPDREILYSNDLTALEAAMSEINTGHDLLDDYSDFYLMDDKLQYLFQKCEDYRDENEYRFCLIDKDLKSPNENLFVPFGKSLKAIIYGERFSRMMKLDVPDDVEQYRIHWVFGTPRLIKLK